MGVRFDVYGTAYPYSRGSKRHNRVFLAGHRSQSSGGAFGMFYGSGGGVGQGQPTEGSLC